MSINTIRYRKQYPNAIETRYHNKRVVTEKRDDGTYHIEIVEIVKDNPDINEVIEFFTKAKEAGATHVDWYAKSDYDGDSEYCQAQPFYEVEETDAEVEIRLKRESDNVKKQIAKSQRREKAEYERLKAKFG